MILYGVMKKMLTFNNLILSLVLTFALGCAVSFKKSEFSLPPKADNEISVMSFNVENLFDTVHDEGKEDYTYLPLAKKNTAEVQAACKKQDSSYRRNECLGLNYDEAGLQKKMTNIASVVLGVDGNGPDNLLLIEVENDNVLGQLNKNYLTKANYITQVLIEGPDNRGIDVAFLSRFPVVGKPVLHPIAWKPKNDEDKKWMERSRGILEVTVKAPNGDPITFMVAHFPSQANPRYWREQAAEFMAELIKAKGPEAMVVAAGDLNITHDEEQEAKIFARFLAPVGAISHFVGCKECDGTHNYRKSWSFLDAQIYNKALLAEGSGSYQVETGTIDVIRYNPVHLKRGKYPYRWDYDKQEGVSDHFPMYVRLKQRSEAKTPVKEEVPAKAPEKKAPAKKKK
ncbi:Endonuclease/Exonuclease/phosphatase family protein [compost metagenome]